MVMPQPPLLPQSARHVFIIFSAPMWLHVVVWDFISSGVRLALQQNGGFTRIETQHENGLNECLYLHDDFTNCSIFQFANCNQWKLCAAALCSVVEGFVAHGQGIVNRLFNHIRMIQNISLKQYSLARSNVSFNIFFLCADIASCCSQYITRPLFLLLQVFPLFLHLFSSKVSFNRAA